MGSSCSPESVFGQRGLADEPAAAAPTARASIGLAAGRNAQGPLAPARLQRRPRPVPLPVPFCLDSEAYADPEGESPYARFAPFMHTLKNQRPW